MKVDSRVATDPLTGLCPELPLMGSNCLSNSSPQVTEGDSRSAADPLTRLRRELPLMGSN